MIYTSNNNSSIMALGTFVKLNYRFINDFNPFFNEVSFLTAVKRKPLLFFKQAKLTAVESTDNGCHGVISLMANLKHRP